MGIWKGKSTKMRCRSITGWGLSHPSEKYEFVIWDDDIPYGKIINSCSKPPVMINMFLTFCSTHCMSRVMEILPVSHMSIHFPYLLRLRCSENPKPPAITTTGKGVNIMCTVWMRLKRGVTFVWWKTWNINQPNEWINQWMNQPTSKKAGNQPTNQPINQPINQSMNQSINQSISQINQAITLITIYALITLTNFTHWLGCQVVFGLQLQAASTQMVCHPLQSLGKLIEYFFLGTKGIPKITKLLNWFCPNVNRNMCANNSRANKNHGYVALEWFSLRSFFQILLYMSRSISLGYDKSKKQFTHSLQYNGWINSGWFI